MFANLRSALAGEPSRLALGRDRVEVALLCKVDDFGHRRYLPWPSTAKRQNQTDVGSP
jgi:hypothetical protein